MFTRAFPIRVVFAALWLMAAGAGFDLILNYQNTSGRVGITPGHWPAGTQIVPDSKHDYGCSLLSKRGTARDVSLEEAAK